MLLIQRLASLLKALISGFTGTLYIHIILTSYFGNSTIIVKGVELLVKSMHSPANSRTSGDGCAEVLLAIFGAHAN